jgi:hypothetical protein
VRVCGVSTMHVNATPHVAHRPSLVTAGSDCTGQSSGAAGLPRVDALRPTTELHRPKCSIGSPGSHNGASILDDAAQVTHLLCSSAMLTRMHASLQGPGTSPRPRDERVVTS